MEIASDPLDSVCTHAHRHIHIFPPVAFRCQSPSCTCASDPPAIDQKFQKSPSLSSIILPEWLTKLKETVFLPDYWFILKDITQEQPDGRLQRTGYVGRGMELLCPEHNPLSLNLHVFSNQEALWTQSSWGFMEASLQRDEWLHYQPLAIDSHLPRRWCGAESTNPLITRLVLLTTSPHP